MKIYEYKAFPNPLRVRMFLAEKGIDGISFEQVDVMKGEHRKQPFLDKNPYGSVPTLELDDGTFISETVAICRYFEEQHPARPLLGGTPVQKAVIEMWQRRVEQTLFDTIGTYFHQATAGLGELELYQNKGWGEQNLTRFKAALTRIDSVLAKSEHIAGNQYSIADITAFCAVGYAAFAKISVPAELTNFKRWYDSVSSRPSAKA